MKSLEAPDTHHLRAAQGWLELGDNASASEELDRITPQLHAHPEVLDMRWHIAAHAKKWDTCVAIAGATIALDPKRPEAWIHRSFALHELRRTQEAFDQLLPMADRFPKVWTIPYNLACYCAQLGRLQDARAWLKKAMTIDESTVKQAALQDPDLKPLRDSTSAA